jgi:hypothetical protein
MAQLIATIAPRIIIPSFFIGQKVSGMTDIAKAFQTVAFSAFFVTSVLTFFQGTAWLSVIPAVAGLSYWYMMNDPANKQKYRYMDWAVTTPLMLIAILLANKQPLLLVAALVALDLEMIGFGYAGVKESDKQKKMVAFLLGCVAFAPIIYFLIQQKKFVYATYLTLFLWTLYPIVWYAEETGLQSDTVITSTYSVLDVCAKVGLIYFLHV